MAARFLFRLLKDIDPQAQYDAIKFKDPLTLYFLANGTGYLGETKIFDTNIFKRIDDISSIKSLVTDMKSDDFIPDNSSVASTSAIVEYIKDKVNYITGIIPDDTETLKELADAIEELKNSIPVLPDKLPADGGNADTVGGKSPDDFANAEHKHDEYSLKEHSHTGYASEDHDHNNYALTEHEHEGYAADNHTHNDYALKNHNHTEYASESHKHSEYASSEHEHENYALTEHEHNEYASVSHEHDYASIEHEHIEYALKKDVSDDVDAINQLIQKANTDIKSNTDAITTLNGKGDGSVDKKITEAFNRFLQDVSDDDTINTFKELLDYASDHDSDIQNLINEITRNKNNLSDLTTILDIHKNDKENPHNVTLTQLGIFALASELNLLNGARFNIQEQIDDKAQKDHTHNITCEDIGADTKGSADAALAEAKAYTDELTSQISQVQIVTWEDDD